MVEPGELDFGRLPIFQAKEQVVRLENFGRGRLVIEDAWVESEDGSYTTSFVEDGPHNLIAGGETNLKIRFSPTKAGSKPATLVVRSEGSLAPLFKLPISGEALDVALKVDTAELNFGKIELDSEKSLYFNYTNPSELPVDVQPKLIGADADEFTAESFTLQPGESRATVVKFTPVRVGQKRAILAVAPCKGCLDQLVNLRAEGLEQAVVAIPPDVDFGQVPIDRDTQNEARLKNISTEPMDLTGMGLTPTTDPSFTASDANFPITLQPNEERGFKITYSPGHMGEAIGGFKVDVSSKRHPTTDFRVRAYGGSPELCVSPSSFDFGTKPVGSLNSVTLTVRNCGSNNGSPLHVDEIYLTEAQTGGSNEDEFHISAVTLPKILNAGEEFKMKVFFEPNRAGPATTVLHVKSTGFQASHQTFAFGGIAEAHDPCNLAITPGAVDFGTLPTGQGAVLGVKIANLGTDICPVKNIMLENDGGGVFSLPGGAIEGLLIEPGNFFSMMIAYNPKPSGGSSFGTLHVEQQNPAQPTVLVPLTANSQASCLIATPPFIDFGNARPDCPPSPLRTRVENSCANPVLVRGVRIGAGTTDGEFQINSVNQTPVTL
ncbi:MAG: choice-of-anchor D domain-containing protein, partial [Myxococcaceae bacterium]